jgi:DNA ligase-1
MSRDDLNFRHLVDTFVELEATRSGNEMVQILSQLFRKTPLAVLDLVSYFIQGSVVAEHEDLNLNMGEKLMAEAISRASGKERSEIDRLYVQHGDYGLVVEAVLGRQPDAKGLLTVKKVHDRLLEIAQASGKGSQEARLTLLADLLSKATAPEAKYIVRIALGTLRLGVGTMTILNALAVTFTGEKRSKALLEKAYNLCGDIGLIARTLAERGLDGLKRITIRVGHPIKMMAAQRVQLLQELLEKLPDGFAVEFKYDGERVQCHKQGDKVTIYSRNLENITHQYPDVVEHIQKGIRVKEAIVEGEVVALVPGTVDEYQEFQVLMSRKRKYDIEKYVERVPTKLFLFDVLYVHGESVMERPYPERRKLLEKITKRSERIDLAQAIFSRDLEEIENFFNEAVERGFEGIVAKSCAADSIYRAGAREWSWIKWKRDYSQELVDSFDLVVVGGFAGRGKRSGTWGAVLCAAYNPELDRFETLCKVSTGFSDEELAKLPEMFKPYERDEPPARVYSKLTPTRWFQPQYVLEVQGAELTRSPIHTCGANSDDSPGIALRFPRFIRFREDKSPEQATSVSEIQAMYSRS